MNPRATRLPLRHYALDWDQLFTESPPPDIWYETMFRWSRDELRAFQNRMFMKRIAQGWQHPFYRGLWGEAGLHEGDIRSLDDLEKLPIFDSEDVKRSIAAHPPFGQVCGIDVAEVSRSVPLKIQTSGGTTGLPRPTIFGPKDWELNGLYLARSLYAQGARPGDRMQIPSTASLANMGWGYYKACHDYLGVIPITTGSGLVTPSKRQLELAFEFGTTLWTSFPEYLLQLAHTARTELARDVRELGTRFVSTYLGPDLDGSLCRAVEQAWGCPAYDNYGTHEVFSVSFEAEDRDGMYIFEDAVYVEVVDQETRKSVPTGSAGDLVCTHLHREVPLLIRYNLRDLGRITSESRSALGSEFRRMDKFLGRSDQMVKIRATNVYPMACLGAVRSDDRTTGEWICVAERIEHGGVIHEELTVRVEVRNDGRSREGLRELLERRLRNDLGLRVPVELVDEGQLIGTNVGKEGKPIRLLDERRTIKRRS
jgi:phenylacetate-CoA ligase